ncbi:MAG: DoxX family protein [Candidatus Taylorbacteria bacterium]|nr:DoxX family protein [Candidatus Taylorbacteria bacterium]
MLNIFPELLDYGFMAPSILRITIGILFVFLGYQKYNSHKEHLSEFLSSIKINPARTIVQTLGGVEIVLGLLFITGTLTQIAALIALIITLVSIVLAVKQPDLKLRSVTEYILISVIATSLILSGAGFMAIDFPL